MTRRCSVKGCVEVHFSNGYCKRHHMQWYRGGNGRVPMSIARPVFKRLKAIYGSNTALARAMNTTKQQVGHLLNEKHSTVNQRTLDRAMSLLAKHEEAEKRTSIPLEVVDTAQLSLILRQWSVKYLNERPHGFVEFTGPTAAIAARTNLNEKTISKYINNQGLDKPWVDVNVAEVLLIAIDEENALRDGRLEVFPNPSLSMEQWVKRMKERGCI